jgi:hypothetical protein
LVPRHSRQAGAGCDLQGGCHRWLHHVHRRGPLTTVPGGLFAQPTNIGYQTNTDFGVVPEASFQVGYQFTRFLRGSVGYSIIYMARNVVQPSFQVDRSINVNQVASLGLAPLAGDLRPAFAFRGTDFWAQGLQFNLEVDF